MLTEGKAKIMSLEEWADLHGEDYPKRKFFSALDWARGEDKTVRGIYCRNCDCIIEFSEMKPWGKDDDTVDMLCPDCGEVLVEGE